MRYGAQIQKPDYIMPGVGMISYKWDGMKQVKENEERKDRNRKKEKEPKKIHKHTALRVVRF